MHVKKILIYNWIPFDETEGKGGGVTVYTKNLISCLMKNEKLDIYFLSSGRAYDMNQYRTFIEATSNIYDGRVRSFQVVNSPVLAAANLSFPYPDISNDDEILKRVMREFLSKHNFDVIHFQNFEGLSIKVLELKKEFPQTKFIFSAHNYYIICPQVMLWQGNKSNCTEKECGECCISCMPRDVHFLKVMLNQFADGKGRSQIELLKVKKALADYYAHMEFCAAEIGDDESSRLASEFKRFRLLNVEYVNHYVDHVLAVSGRVAEILIEKGVNAEKVHVNYIGTKMAEHASSKSSFPYQEGIFHICYLGYMRTMKGFYFLLDTLEAMPEAMSRKISVTIAAKKTDEIAEKRISALQEQYAGIQFYNGYTHDKLPEILQNVNLGIVPPLWEDNLPQVAIEMQALGIPILCSNLGGAKEIVGSQEFVFEAGNISDFIYKLKRIMDTPQMLEWYWENTLPLIRMDEHIQSLMNYYDIES